VLLLLLLLLLLLVRKVDKALSSAFDDVVEVKKKQEAFGQLLYRFDF
jgi:Na+-transporting methylmalonyl-CoA/oxaloacetate decarboxylase gamma subunit